MFLITKRKLVIEWLEIDKINRTSPRTIEVTWISNLTDANYSLICSKESIKVIVNYTKEFLKGNCSFDSTISGYLIKVKLLASSLFNSYESYKEIKISNHLFVIEK